MLEEHAKLAAVFQAAGEIVGRKKLQKIIYIARQLNFPFQEKYEYHFFGPYSEELTLRIQELCNLSFLEEKKEKKGGYIQYRYRLTDEGRKFLQMYRPPLPDFAEVICKMNEKSARFLELVATVLYFSDWGREEVWAKIMTLKKKQNYTKDELEAAYTYIDNLRKMVS